MAVAGCTTDTPTSNGIDDDLPVDEPPWYGRALQPEGEHDHNEPRDHLNMSSRNIELLGWDPLSSPWYDGTTMPGYSCAANDPSAADDPDRPKVIYTISYASDVAFTAVNVTNPEEPRWMSEFVLPNAHSDGIGVTGDGKYVVFGSEATQGGDRNDGGGRTAGSVVTADPACPGATLLPADEPPADDHVYLVDVADPYQPTYVDSFKLAWPWGPHTIKVGEIDGTSYAFAFVAYGMVPNPAHPQPNGNLFFGGYETSRVYIFEIGPKPLGGTGLNLVGSWGITPQETLPDPTASSILHDGWVQKHPVTGEHLLYLAAWDEGVVILNIDDPRTPVEVGRWSDYETLDPYEATGNIHHVVPIEETWDGRHYTILGPENFQRPPGDIPAAWTYIVDTTDPANPELAGKWRLPADPQDHWDHAFQFSPHFLRIYDRHIYMAHFHAGAWIIDISTPERLKDPQAVGVFVPDRIPDDVYEGRRVLNSLPLVVDLEVTEDGAYVVDWQSGIYSIRYHPELEP